MKAKEITLNLTRNLGNYETARMAVTYEVTEDDDVVDSFVSAKMEIFQFLLVRLKALQVQRELIFRANFNSFWYD